jgi:hypothetical protein
MFRFSMRSSSGSFVFISLSMLLILKIVKIFKKCYHSVVVMWQHMSSVSVMRTVWRRELESSSRPAAARQPANRTHNPQLHTIPTT